MRSFSLFRIALAAMFVMGCSAVSHAQCSNANINQAFSSVLHRAPRGSGNSGECNPNNYGGGSWSGQADLMKRVGAASYCSDPWIGQVYYYTYNRYPSNAECNGQLYNRGQWSSYMDLASKVQAYQNSLHAAPMQIDTAATRRALAQYHVDGGGNLIAPQGVIVAYAGHFLIDANIVAQGGGNIVAQGGGNIVAQGGGNLITPRAGMLVNTNGSNFIVRR
ncbi:MAG: hypothetical protein V4555_14290 [Acidobacteriota bacterium]